jgi:hypothetical protein
MLAIRLILIAAQLIATYMSAPFVTRLMPSLGGQLNLITYAGVAALIVWMIGLATALLLRDLGRPSLRTLWFSLVLALIGAAVAMLPEVTSAVSGIVPGVPLVAYPLLGAVIGYTFRR